MLKLCLKIRPRTQQSLMEHVGLVMPLDCGREFVLNSEVKTAFGRGVFFRVIHGPAVCRPLRICIHSSSCQQRLVNIATAVVLPRCHAKDGQGIAIITLPHLLDTHGSCVQHFGR